jgi:hypothetical protein
MAETSQQLLERFLIEVMEIERRYSTEYRGAKTQRQGELREMLEKFVAKNLEDENS